MSLEITSVLIVLPKPGDDERVICYCSITLNDCFRVHGAKLIRCLDGRVRMFWPERKGRNGRFVSICHALNERVRSAIEWAVLRAYRAHLDERACDRSIGRVAKYNLQPTEAAHAS